MVARLTKEADGSGWWRVSYGEISGLTNEELIKRQPMKFEAMLPGHPKPDDYDLAAISPYKIHQRLVDKMAVGRICLAADAAHSKPSCQSNCDEEANTLRAVCNPFGGLGLTGGIVDVGGLYDCLAGIYEGKADRSILDTYSEIRRKKYQELTDPISQENLRRLFDQDPDKALETDEFLKTLKNNENDVEAQRIFLRGANALKYDFTQHYKGADTGSMDRDGESVKGGAMQHVEQMVVGPE